MEIKATKKQCVDIEKSVMDYLIADYQEHKEILNGMETNSTCEDDLFFDTEYNFHKGYCDAAETWMNVLGIRLSD